MQALGLPIAVTATVATVMASAPATGDVASATAQPATAATAARLHATPDGNAAKGVNEPAGEAISPNGRTVFVTGTSGLGSDSDYATVAYSAAGRQSWVRRYHSAAGYSVAYSVAVSPAGTSVFVTGRRWSGRTTGAYATIAYSATTGRQLWSRRYNVRGGWAYSVAVNQAGTIMFVSGENEADALTFEYATIAYSAATGRQLWARLYSTPGDTYGASHQRHSLSVATSST
jgi:hypothetical protein